MNSIEYINSKIDSFGINFIVHDVYHGIKRFNRITFINTKYLHDPLITVNSELIGINRIVYVPNTPLTEDQFNLIRDFLYENIDMKSDDHFFVDKKSLFIIQIDTSKIYRNKKIEDIIDVQQKILT